MEMIATFRKTVEIAPVPFDEQERAVEEKRTNRHAIGRAADSPVSPPLVCCIKRAAARRPV